VPCGGINLNNLTMPVDVTWFDLVNVVVQTETTPLQPMPEAAARATFLRQIQPRRGP
jgi:hypothetical protein